MAIHIKDLPKCINCNKDIMYYDTFIKDGILKYGKSALSKKGNFKLVICEHCLTEKYPSYQHRNKSRVFNRMCEETKYAFNIPDDVYEKEKNKFIVRSLNNFIEKYGEEEGTIRWESYKNKQSITNTFKYKKEKYNMSEEDFDMYNKSRSATLNNFIKRHGEEDGKIKWEEYKNMQKITKSKDYMISKYGEEKTNLINKSKANTLKNYIQKYGEEEGTIRYDTYILNSKSYFSKISQSFFNSIDSILSTKFTTYYASKNIEYGVKLKDTYIKLDYFILELNLCIEFNGTMFHADPRIYLPNDIPSPYSNLSAAEVQKKDAERYTELKKCRDINTIIMWEIDYNEKTFSPEMYIKNILKININE